MVIKLPRKRLWRILEVLRGIGDIGDIGPATCNCVCVSLSVFVGSHILFIFLVFDACVCLNNCLRELQLSMSSRAFFGGAYFSAVSGWKSIPISVPGPCEVTESYRLLGFCLTITFCLNPAQQAVSHWNGRDRLKDLFDLFTWICYRAVSSDKYLWSPRREILQIYMAISMGKGLLCWI